MAQIHVLDSETIDKIAAGEVVERPASVVKELVENAIDAKATAVTVEAKDGGIEFIRVTDNGTGMEGDQIRRAFLRHATSKIEDARDLERITSLGFRGEALSSIAAVSRVEVISKTAESLAGVRILLEGGREVEFGEVGAPEGTTFLMRNLFFNTPVRRKFLKTPASEGGYICDLMEHLALSRPDISFQFILGGQTRFHTSGNGDLKEVIYRIYGRETASSLVPIQWEQEGVRIEGYLGKPVLVRSNRSFEIYFINGRFVKSSVVAGALEGGYREYLMQHKFPFCVLHIQLDPHRIDVNVHPTKLDVRVNGAPEFRNIVTGAVRDTLKKQEMIPDAVLGTEKEAKNWERESQRAFQRERSKEHFPEPFEQRRRESLRVMEEANYSGRKTGRPDFSQNPVWARVRKAEEDEKISRAVKAPEGQQMNFFEEKLLIVENRDKYRLIGQVFETYWMIQFEDKLLIIDQHAAHEKVKYERMMKRYREKAPVSQNLLPPVIVSLTGQEEAVLEEYLDVFRTFGFEIEAFGGNEYALRSVPADLYGCSEREMFLEVMDQLQSSGNRGTLKAVEEKIASMSCKAAVKGNNRLSVQEAQELIDELLTLENPYNCPHGRPTIIAMSRTEMEKKFKRIV